MKNILFFLVVVFFFFSCSGGKFIESNELLKKINLTEYPGQEKYPEADGVILLAETLMDMEVVGRALVSYEEFHFVMKLFKNIEDYASVEINIYNDEKLENISARTIKEDGTIVDVKKEEFYKIKGESGGSVFYADRESVRFTFPAIEKNCIVEYRYKKYKRRPFVTDIWYIQYPLPVVKNIYTLSIPRGLLEFVNSDGSPVWNWNFKAYNYYLEKPSFKSPKFMSTGKSIYEYKVTSTWELNNVLPFEKEEMMPDLYSYRGYVKFSPNDWKKWNDISEWYYNQLFLPQLEITQKIKNLASELTENSVTEEEKIKAIYNYVKKIRYISINLGIGGIQPSTPQTVLDRNYGDCKDKSILLISLLKAAGIKAKPVLVLTSSYGKIDPIFPSWMFNHMICKAITSEGVDIWMDPTSKYSSLGDLPFECEGLNVLVLNEDGTSQIEKTPIADASRNNSEISLTFNLNNNNSANFLFDYKFYGKYNSYYRGLFEDKTETELKDIFKAWMIDEFSNFTIDNYTITFPDDSEDVLSLLIEGNIANAMTRQGDLYFVNADPMKFFESGLFLLKEQRRYPLAFRFPRTLQKAVTINIPERYSVRNIPDNFSVRNDNFTYSKTFFTVEENKITMNESYKLMNNLVSVNNYPVAKRGFENIRNKYNDKIVLIRN